MAVRLIGLGRMIVFLLIAGVGVLIAAPASGGITSTGNVLPSHDTTDPWLVGADLRIADSADGTLSVSGGSGVTNLRGFIGYTTGSTGDVTIDGAGTYWTNTNELHVGYGGDASLMISGGADVTSYYGILADQTTSSGLATVTGAGSTWTIDDYLAVGYEGGAGLTVSSGGSVSALDMAIGFMPDSNGVVHVTGADSSLAADENLVVGMWGEGELNIANGGQVSAEDAFIGGVDPWIVDDEVGQVGYAPNGTGTVEISGADSLFTVSDMLYVGYSGDANMVVTDAADVTDLYGLIGYDPNSHGIATVSGTGSTWTHTGGLGVGILGDGDLIVEDGGQVLSLESGIGLGPDSVGTVLVTGTDSLWANMEELAIGAIGSGTLTISNGGRVTNTDTYIGGLDLDAPNIDVSFLGDAFAGTGTVLVTGTGSRWETDGGLYVGYTGTGTLDVNDGGVVTSDLGVVGADPDAQGTVRVSDGGSQWLLSDALVVGAFGQGDVTVSGGGQIDANEGYVGGFDPDLFEREDIPDFAPGTGTITVTGTGSQFDVSEFLFVGYTGTGTLDVNDGGVVTSEYGAVGADPNSVGTVTVADVGSRWSVSEALAIGGFGQGDLTISSGGRVDANEAYVGGFDPDALGDDADGTPLGTGTVTVTGAGSQFNVDDFLYVGYTGTGTLDVNDGGVVTSEYGGIAADPDSTGTVTVTGTGSVWDVDEALAVGAFGTGYLTISDGGRVNAEDSFVAGFDPSIFDDVDGDPNGDGRVTVTGSGSLWANSGNLTVGFGGVGQMLVEAGGQVTSTDGAVGAGPTGDGTVTVTGAGSSWDMGDAFSVGGWGTGALTIADGGEVTNVDAYIGGFRPSAFGIDPNVVGYNPNGTGAVTVTGAGSQWTSSGDLNVGYLGEGTLTVSNGGQVNAVDVVVGEYTTGTLSVSGGGAMDANTVWIGRAQNVGDGVVTVAGSGSTFDADDIYVGAWGQGELTISDGAQMTSTTALVGAYWSGAGTVRVTGGSSEWVMADDLYVGYAGTGVLDVNDGARVVVDESLYIGGSDTGSNGTGTVMITDGADALIGEELYVWETGTLGGDGTISIYEPTTLHNYGTIAPGDDGIGTLTVEGNVVFEPNSVFEVEIGNSSADRLMVDGDVTVSGGTVRVQSAGTVVGSREYDIIEADSVTGTFDVLDTALLDFYFNDIGLEYDSTTVVLWIDAMQFDDPNLVRTYNQQQVGGAFQEIAGNGGNDITAGLQELPEFDDVREAYDQLAGRTRPSLAPISVAGTARFMGTISNRLRNPGAVMASALGGSSLSAKAGPDAGYSSASSYEIDAGGTNFAVGNGSSYLSDSKWGFWGKGYGLFGTRDGSLEAPGYDYTTYGVGFGLDYQFTDTLLLGLTGGYSDGDVDYDGSPDNSDLSATQLGVYGSWDAGGTYVDSLLTYSDLDYETQRYVELTDEQLEGDFGGYAVSGYFETGFDWRQIQGWQLQPLASFQFSYMDLDSYTESGGDAALGYDDQTYESYIGSLGTKVTKNLLRDSAESHLVAQFRARWLHEFGDTRSDVNTFFASDPTTVFHIRDSEIARDSAVLGVGLGAQLNANTRLYVDYDTRLNADDTAHLISGGLQYRW